MANGKPEEPIPSNCLLGHDNQRRISTVERDLDGLKEDMDRAITEVKTDLKTGETGLWGAIEKLQNRLPVWGTFAFAGLAAIASAALTVVISKAFG